MTDSQRKQLVDALLARREVHKLQANGQVYDAVVYACQQDIAALEPVIDAMIMDYMGENL